MKISGWGRFPIVDASAVRIERAYSDHTFIPNGNFRSYGDAALAPCFVNMRKHNKMIAFDPESGLLTCESGVLLSEIVERFVPDGWYLAVVPGTKYITVGGAVAADVHGKNHHVAGCFSEWVISLKMMLPSGEEIYCSAGENQKLFRGTCGGMGLTGIILEATIRLKKISSRWVTQKTIKTYSLQETFAAFEACNDVQYSVAWIDSMAKGENLGRSILMVGDFDTDGDLNYRAKSAVRVPFNFPSFALNKFTIKVFNFLYFAKTKHGESDQKVELDQFFHPLDRIANWNRIYGKSGFVQFQFILPKKVSFLGLTTVLSRLERSGFASFLSVLKLYGPQNKNYLSFPMEGYSLAMDFKVQPGLVEVLSELTDLVCEMGGRIYLAKDALMTSAQFEMSYANANSFRELRKRFGVEKVVNSELSKRLGI